MIPRARDLHCAGHAPQTTRSIRSARVAERRRRSRRTTGAQSTHGYGDLSRGHDRSRWRGRGTRPRRRLCGAAALGRIPHSRGRPDVRGRRRINSVGSVVRRTAAGRAASVPGTGRRASITPCPRPAICSSISVPRQWISASSSPGRSWIACAAPSPWSRRFTVSNTSMNATSWASSTAPKTRPEGRHSMP